MPELILALLTALGGGLTLAALLATLIYLLPQRVSRARHALQRAPGRAFLVGLANALFFGILAALFSQGGDLGGLLALLILLALLALAAIGLAGTLLLLRERIYAPAPSTLAVTLKTGLLLIAAALAPIIGWFVLAPILLLVGLGAALLGWRAPKTTPAPFPPEQS